MSVSDREWMALALRLARRGYYSTAPNPRVGCVIVGAGRELARGWHEAAGEPHAEVNALAAAELPPGCDVYVTLEPCCHHGRTPPCVDALLAAAPARVVVAMQDPNPAVAGRGIERLRAAGVAVECGLLGEQAQALNRGFVKRMRAGLPFVTVKMAASLDGRTALASGDSRWITGAAARRDVQFRRAAAGAILSSAQTVLDDDPRLDVRLDADDLGQRRPPRQPLRAIVDSRLRLSGNERLFAAGGEVLIYTLADDTGRRAALAGAGARIVDAVAGADGRVDLAALLRDLAARGVNDVHTECGPRLAGALVATGLADEILLYLAPHLLGDAARGLFGLGELSAMTQRKELAFRDIRRLGDDLRLTVSTTGD